MRFRVAMAAVCLSISGLMVADSVRADGADSAQSPASDSQKENLNSLGSVLLAQSTPGQTSGTARTAKAGNEPEQTPGQLQEVIVTSTRREVSLEAVPASVTAVTGVELAQRGIQEFEDIAPTIPSLAFTMTGEGHSEARTISIRGVSSTSNVNLSEATGFYLDDTPIPFAVDPKFFDIQRIEVLRGPQGTLYGARSMGGTFKIITNSADPTTTSGHINLDANYVDQGGVGYLGSGTVNLPVGPDGAVRVSAYGEHVPGVQNKLVTSTGQYYPHVSDSGTFGAMLSGLWHVGNGWDLMPKLIYQNSNYDGLPYADIYPSNTLQERDQDVSEAGWDHWTLASLTLGKKSAFGQFSLTASYFYRFFLDREDISEFDQLIAPAVTPGAVFTGPGPGADYQTQKIWTGEARFVSEWQGPFQFVGGLYDQSYEKVRDGLLDAPGFGAATGTTDILFDGGDTTIQKEFAVYGEGTLRFAPKWDLTIGLRWSDSTVHLERNVTGLFGAPAFTRDTPATETTPKAALSYTPVDTLHFYASASKGYRLGGVNFTVPTAAACSSPSDLEAFDALHGGSTFNPDSLWNYEFGAKMELFDRRVRINAAAFVIDWTDIQQHVNVCGFNLVVNAGDARNKGGEVELTALLTPTLTLGISGSKINARLTTAVPLFASAGDRILGVPDWIANGFIEWRAPISPEWSAFVRPDVTYTGTVVYEFMQTGTPADQGQGGTTQYDLRAGLSRRAWEFAVYGTNLSDVRRNYGPNTSFGAEIPGRPRLGVNETRTVGVRATWTF
jgi:outer membrane receptor protein involved in Fe transport